MTLKCKNCDWENSKNETYCGNCGNKIINEVQNFKRKEYGVPEKSEIFTRKEYGVPANEQQQQDLKYGIIFAGILLFIFVMYLANSNNDPGVADGVKAEIYTCSLNNRFRSSTVKITNLSSELKDVSVTVGYYDSSGKQLDVGYAITTVPAKTTAFGTTLVGPKWVSNSCKIISTKSYNK